MSVSNVTVVKNMIWRYAERFLAQGVSFFVSLILVRLLTPEDYGTVALVTVLVGILDVFSTRGFNQAIIQKKEVDDLDYSTIFVANMGIESALYIVIFAVAPFIAKFYNNIELIALIRFISIRILVTGFNAIQQAYVQRNMLYRKFFLSTLLGTLVSAFVGIWMALKGYGVWALAFQTVVNTFIDTFVLFLTIDWRPHLKFSFARLKEMLHFGINMFVMAVFESIYNELRSLVIGKWYTSSDLAFYNKGKNIPELLINNIQIAANNVFFAALSREKNYEDVKKKMREYMGVMFYILAPMLLGIVTISNNLIQVLYTSKWMETRPYMILYCIIYLSWILQMPILQAINSRGRVDITLKLTILHRIIGIGILILWISKGPVYIAVGALIADYMITVVDILIAKKMFCYTIAEMGEDIGNTLFCVCISMGCVHVTGSMIDNIWLSTILQVIVGIIAYILFSLLFKNKLFIVLEKALLQKIKRK